jgi:hypothetical protein
MRRIIALSAAMVVFGAIGSLVAQEQQQPRHSDLDPAARLHALGQALQMYVNQYKGFLPADLSLLAHVTGSEQLGQEAQRDFIYTVPPGTRIIRLKTPSQHAVALSKPKSDEPLVVLFADGQVRTYVPARTRPTTMPQDFAAAVRGAWQTKAGLHIATYQFNHDGSFTLTFVPDPAAGEVASSGTGTASGTWRQQGKRLLMTNSASNSAFSIPGEQVDAEVVSLNETTLVLKTKNRKGQDEQVTLHRVGLLEKGKRDDDKIVGTWNAEALTLVLADSGMAVFGPSKGEWSQRGDQLLLSLDPSPGAPGQHRFHDQRVAQEPRMNVTFRIELLNDTTLVITGAVRPEQQEHTFTFLRVK